MKLTCEIMNTNCIKCNKETKDKILDIPFCKKHKIKSLIKILK